MVDDVLKEAESQIRELQQLTLKIRQMNKKLEDAIKENEEFLESLKKEESV